MGINNIAVLFPGQFAFDQGVAVIVEPFVVSDLSSGAYSISGPDNRVSFLDSNTYQFTGPTVIDNTDGSFAVSSE